MLPGWFGVGTAVADWVGDDQVATCRAAARCTSSGRGFAPSSPTWRRCWRRRDLTIAARYQTLAADVPHSSEFFEAVTAEHARAVWTAQAVSGHDDLLYDNPAWHVVCAIASRTSRR